MPSAGAEGPGGPGARRAAFDPAAEAEMLAAAGHYDDQVPGLGEDFITEVERAAAYAAEWPAAGSPVEGGFRRVFVHRFPYGVIYRTRGAAASEGVEVLAVAHLHRRPDYWRARRR